MAGTQRQPQHTGRGQRHGSPLRRPRPLVRSMAQQHVDQRIDEVTQAGVQHPVLVDGPGIGQPVAGQQQRAQAKDDQRARLAQRRAQPGKAPQQRQQAERCNTISTAGTCAISSM